MGLDLYLMCAGMLPELVYENWVDDVLLFDTPEVCVDKIAALADAGARRLLLWMGVGGVEHELVVRSMKLFAEKVAPRFR
jgi:hypothetical protein